MICGRCGRSAGDRSHRRRRSGSGSGGGGGGGGSSGCGGGSGGGGRTRWGGRGVNGGIGNVIAVNIHHPYSYACNYCRRIHRRRAIRLQQCDKPFNSSRDSAAAGLPVADSVRCNKPKVVPHCDLGNCFVYLIYNKRPNINK